MDASEVMIGMLVAMTLVGYALPVFFRPKKPLATATAVPGEPFELELVATAARPLRLWLTFLWEGPIEALDRNEDPPPLAVEARVLVVPPAQGRVYRSPAARIAPGLELIDLGEGGPSWNILTNIDRRGSFVHRTVLVRDLPAFAPDSHLRIEGRVLAAKRPGAGSALLYYRGLELFVSYGEG
jgi:hypothetical protein